MKLSLPRFFKLRGTPAHKRINTRSASITVCLALAALIAGLHFAGFFHSLEARSLDLRFKLRGPIAVHPAVRVIGIDDLSLAAFGRWPWPRSYQANLIDILTGFKPRAVVYDMLFTEPTEDKPAEDAALSASFRKSGRVILGAFFRPVKEGAGGARKGAVSPELARALDRFALLPAGRGTGRWFRGSDPTLSIPMFDEAALGSGFVNVTADADGKLRRIPLLIKFNGKFYPSLALRAVMAYWDIPRGAITVRPGRAIELLPRGRAPIRIPVDRRGFTYINYASTLPAFSPVSFGKLMVAFYGEKSGEAVKLFERFRDSIVLVGVTATATTDLISTPYIGLEPGISMQASLVNSILQGKFVTPSPLWLVLVTLFGLALGTGHCVSRRGPLGGFFVFAAFALGYLLAAGIVFVLTGWWLAVVAPLTVIALTYVAALLIQFIGVRLDKQILEQELSIAEKIQRSFLPRELPQVPGARFAAQTVMAKEVGGDLYDFLAFEDGSVGAAIGDVSGKGVPAALYMAKTISDFRTHGRAERTPARMLTALNRTLVQEGASGMFVTFFYVLLEPAKGTVTYSSAGHHPLLCWHSATGEITEHNTQKGKPLGIVPFKNLDEGVLPVASGDLLLLYTDGIDEAMNRHRQTFGKARILETLKLNASRDPADILQALHRAARSFAGSAPQHDDMTLIAVRIV